MKTLINAYPKSKTISYFYFEKDRMENGIFVSRNKSGKTFSISHYYKGDHKLLKKNVRTKKSADKFANNFLMNGIK